MKVVCIDDKNLILPKGSTLLTKGKIYDITFQNGDIVYVEKDDYDQGGSWYKKDRFVDVRKLKLERILNNV